MFNNIRKNIAQFLLKRLPYSMIINSGLFGSIVTKTDALDFYTGWVYACINKRADRIAAIEPKLYEMNSKGEVVEIEEGDLLALINKPNSQMTKHAHFQLTEIYLDLHGIAPWVFFRDKSGMITEMQVANPQYFSETRAADGTILKYIYQIGQYKTEFNPQDVLILKEPDPANPDKGLGMIEAVRLIAEMDEYAKQWNKNLLLNDARPSGIFKSTKNVDPAVEKRMRKQLKEKYSGYDKAYQIMMLWGGMEFQPLSVAPKDLEFIEGRKLNKEDIAGIFGIPMPLINLNEANRASAQAADYIFSKETIEPRAMKIFEQINEFLVPQFSDKQWLWFAPIAKDDRVEKINEYNLAVDRWMTVNEVRDELGLAALIGGDYIYKPLSLVPVVGGEQKAYGEKIAQLRQVKSDYVDLKTQKNIRIKIKTRNFKRKKMAEGIAQKVIDQLIEKKKIVLKIVPEKKEDGHKERVATWYKIVLDENHNIELLWQKEFRKFFTEQGDRFLKALKDKLKAIKKADRKSVVDDIGIDEAGELKTTIEIINPLVWETVMKGVGQALNYVDKPGATFDTEFLKKWCEKVSKEIGKQINDTTIAKFTDTLEEGIGEGESIADLSKRVETVFEWSTGPRSELIARTEVNRATSEAHRQVYVEYGYEKAEWVLSSAPCDECISKSDEDWTMESIDGEQPVHCNCECKFVPKLS